jgi:hypothetical protein
LPPPLRPLATRLATATLGTTLRTIAAPARGAQVKV